MKVLVTGGAGYIGGTVATLLRAEGHSVTVLDNFCHSKPGFVPADVDFIEGDIADRPLVEAVLRNGKIEAVMNFAALIEAGESMVKPGVYFRNNTVSTLGLLEAMHAVGVNKIVFSSTAAVYGEPEEIPITENAKLQPTNPYGESKLLTESMLNWFHTIHGLKVATLRYFNVAGALPGRGEAHEPESHLIPLILDAALGRRDSIAIYGEDYDTPDGTCIRDYIHVVDLAQAHILALAMLKEHPRLKLNLGNGSGFSVKEVIASAKRVTGRDFAVQTKERRAGDPARLVASSARAQCLGWKPQYTNLDDIIQSAWDWHQQLHART